ncbi:acyl-CoA synthetase [Streptomyces rapamycinicus]|uniref:Acyl-CoA synthetase n=2 Tax=Streptomyces rapamycinicus TaxID=1226757 RepID=A0A0A0NJC7_STRRN|nr:acyl-CoA synthetase [Streptomyces rapamycinicus]AGP57301.1 acyl-CoA synthetase [Streptomyces rapamycinicus NRRL 5491]MBB4784945.1 fatty acid CoA ligase FadD36 [Streptomyces rapamycinicus]RLV79578.1 acyl-CoA synthetase [Streptomyces rapamycinicus NRRL 5491]UTO65184.1 acyl-CoA synthetase [Streptomyces rapamycinicus]UTP33140.1 acyl-CoA synthetase [Streptomyces rapamycinicus NRRL 5491]
MTAPLLTSLAASGDDRPDALSVGGRALSREELLGAAGAVAARIAGAPVVAVRATATPETVVAVVGALLAGVPVVPVPPDSGPAERDHILRDSGATLLLTGEAVDAPVETVPVDLTERAAWTKAEPDPESTAFVLYTSGTTGAPKGALISRRAVAADLDGLAAAWAWTPEDTLVHGLPLFHVHGLVLGVLGALRTGSRLVHTGKPTPAAYAAADGSLYFGVPTVWNRIVQDPDSARALASARLLVSGSAPLPAPVFRELERLTGQRPIERYGMTETLITISTRADGERRPGYVGTPLSGIRTRIAAEEGAEIGELQLTGPTLFDGYLNRPEATAGSYTEDGWFRTGDIAAIDPDGFHRIVGRASTDMIKSGGYRIGAGEVENALLDHPAVREAAVVGAPHEDLGQEIVAYVVADGIGERELIDFVASQLSVHKRPRKVRFLEALPRNAMGKPQKKLLPPA